MKKYIVEVSETAKQDLESIVRRKINGAIRKI